MTCTDIGILVQISSTNAIQTTAIANRIPVVSLLMETAPPEALISIVEPPSRSHLGHSGGSPVLPALKSPKTGMWMLEGHATMGAASEDKLRVIPAKQFKSGNNEMKGKLQELARSKEHENADCLVIFLMSHGHPGLIFGSDMNKVYLNNDVFSLFNNDNCPVLQGKPKLFFVQSCRGRENDIGTTNIAHDTSDAALLEPEQPQSLTKLERVSTWSDMYIAY